MDRKKIFRNSINSVLLAFVLILTGTVAVAQPNVNSRNIISPRVNDNGTVTFSLHAPLAKTVIVQGEWMANRDGSQMTKGADGIWSFTTDKLLSDFYRYSFLLDSVRLTDPSNPYTIRGGSNTYSIFIVNNGNGDVYRVNDVPHGMLIRTWYPSAQFKTDRRVTVYTPPGYETSNERYPVLYLLHGSGGDEDSWVTEGRVTQIMDNMIAQGKIKPMIVVMPNGNPSQQGAPGETKENFMYRPVASQNMPGFAVGTEVMAFDEIVKYVDSHFRTKAQKSQRAVSGFSMGGFHSILISANHPDLFDYMGLFAPGTPTSRINSELGLDLTTLANKNLEEKYAIQKKNGFKLFWVAIGKSDFLYASTQQHLKILDNLQFPYSYVESEGGHSWFNARSYFMQFTQLIFRSN